MSLSEVGVPGQRVDVLNGGDVALDGRLLSVAEIQQAFRELRARAAGCEARTVVLPRPGAGTGPTAGGGPNLVLTDAAVGGDATSVMPSVGGDGGEQAEPMPDIAASAGSDEGDGGELGAGWVAVIAAHPGAGASTVALAIS